MEKIHKISRKNLQQIYSKVCSGWQGQIDNHLNSQKFSDEISVNNSVILSAYKQADKSQKELIKTYFDLELPEDRFKNIKNYSDFCRISGLMEILESDFSFLRQQRRRKACAQAKLQQIEEFFNEGFVIDWKDQSQYKYYPYFTINNHGGLVFDAVCYGFSCFKGAPAYFRDEETAKFVGNTFINIYQNLM